MRVEEFEWGFKHNIVELPETIIDLLRVRPQGYSSIHSHQYLTNRLYLISGSFLIYEVDNEIESRRSTNLTYNGPGILIPNGMIHQFWNPSPDEWAIVIEIVTGTPLDREDIFRYSQRGVGIP